MSEDQKPLENASAAESKLTSSPYVIHPLIDWACCGGLSIIVIIGVFVVLIAKPDLVDAFSYEHALEEAVSVTEQEGDGANASGSLVPSEAFSSLAILLVLSTLINHPHFMMSYRLLYNSKEQISEYRWSSIWMPALLVLVLLFGVFAPADLVGGIGPMMLEGLNIVAALYLAWHYNGQAWGMVASFCYLKGVKLNKTEKTMIRSGLRVMTGLHVLIALMLVRPGWTVREFVEQRGESLGVWLHDLLIVVIIVAAITLPLGLKAFVSASKRAGRGLPKTAFTSWLAVYFWYALLYFQRDVFGVLVIVQLAHALQYLVFTTRVELNRNSSDVSDGIKKTLFTFVGAVLVGIVVFDLPGWVGMSSETVRMYGMVMGALASAINIHHYFVDGAIWKISNPRVRKDLFAHLQT